MKIKKYIAELFDDEPEHWGLRGDPYLWREFREHFSDTPVPSSSKTLEQEIENAFQLLTGQPLSSSADVHIERLAHGGMSSGWISPLFWREKVLPLLKTRHAEQ